MKTETRGAPLGNKNAEKKNALKVFACRLPDEIRTTIKEEAKQLGISQGAYIALLVEADQK